MKRRTLLRSLLTAPAVAALPAVVQAQQATPATETPKTQTTDADASAEPILKTFNKAQFSALRKLGEIMMPKTQDTPGALDAGAAEFLDFLIGASAADRVALYRDGLDRLNAEAQKHYRKSFAEISAAEAEPILAPLRAAWTYKAPSDRFALFLLEAKSDLMRATANSREYSVVVSQRRRGAGGLGQYWYPIE